jgi:hypothetical protein
MARSQVRNSDGRKATQTAASRTGKPRDDLRAAEKAADSLLLDTRSASAELADRDWFAGNPTRGYRLRPRADGEITPHGPTSHVLARRDGYSIARFGVDLDPHNAQYLMFFEQSDTLLAVMCTEKEVPRGRSLAELLLIAMSADFIVNRPLWMDMDEGETGWLQ